MNRYLWAALVVLVWAAGASAGINTTKPIGPVSLYLDPNGDVYMVNDGAVPFQTDGYTILSASGLLPPLDGICGDPWGPWEPWLLLGGSPELWIPPMPPWPGPNCGEWSEMSETPYNYSEVTMGMPFTFQAGGMVKLGTGLFGGTQADLTFTYVDSGTGGSWEGAVIPEPGTLALLGLGVFGLVRRRP